MRNDHAPTDHALTDQEFLRYSRQLLLEDIGPEGQEKLKKSRVLLVGMGGLGAPAALYLAAAGVGALTIADDDKLHISNLQRQILYRTQDISRPKVTLAKQQLLALNPLTEVITLTEHLAGETLRNAVQQADLVLDCSDNMATRHVVNAACIQQQKPLVSGSAIGFSGQLLVLTPPTRPAVTPASIRRRQNHSVTAAPPVYLSRWWG